MSQPRQIPVSLTRKRRERLVINPRTALILQNPPPSDTKIKMSQKKIVNLHNKSTHNAPSVDPCKALGISVKKQYRNLKLPLKETRLQRETLSLWAESLSL
jgi:hypothetical protein